MNSIKEFLSWIGYGILRGLGFLWDWLTNAVQNFLHEMRNNNKYRQRFISMMVLPITVLYYEIVFNLSTVRSSFRMRPILIIFFFSMAWGLFFYLFCSISRRARLNRRLLKLLQILSMLPFGISYFIYLQFRVFYDLNTIFAGAGGALTGFGSAILRMVFSPKGLFHLFLFMLPFLLYYWLGPKDVARSISHRFRRRVILAIFVFHLLALLVVATGGVTRSTYGNKYSYNNSIVNFGMLTSTRKEVQGLLFGRKQSSFQEVEEESEAEATSAEEPAETRQKEFSQMDIDFDEAASLSNDADFQEINTYVQSLSPSRTNTYTGLFEGKNLIMISAEAWSPWFVSEDLTPTMYRLLHKGIYFQDAYQMAGSGTTGGELQNIIGVEPLAGGNSMLKLLSHNNYFTMGSQLDRLGYYGRTFHNNEYRFYDRVETHNNLGYSDTFLGYGNGMEEYVQDQWPESDLEMMQGTLPTYIDKQPFNVYYMTVSGHSIYTQESNEMSDKNYSRVADLPYSEDVKCYIAANLELEDALTYLVEELDAKGIADETVIVMTADHFPYGLEDDALLEELYGHPITNVLERDQTGLIIWCKSLEGQEPIVVSEPVFSLDILPTLSNLFGLDWDSRLLVGRDVFSDAQPLVFNMEFDWKTDKGYYIASEDTFVSTSGESVSQEYINRIGTIVENKLHLCELLLDYDYYGTLFGKNDTQMSEEEANRREISQFDDNAEETGNWGPDS